VVKLGNSSKYVDDGDTLKSTINLGLLESVSQNVTPAIGNLNSAIKSLELLINNVNSVLDPNTKNNLQSVIANAAATTAQLETC
jgi:phospholipid/cholesterol/gamma-HCH transport system substrate-binding protein